MRARVMWLVCTLTALAACEQPAPSRPRWTSTVALQLGEIAGGSCVGKVYPGCSGPSGEFSATLYSEQIKYLSLGFRGPDAATCATHLSHALRGVVSAQIWDGINVRIHETPKHHYFDAGGVSIEVSVMTMPGNDLRVVLGLRWP